MYTIDRLIGIIEPKQPFMDWLESTPGWDLGITLDDLRKDCMALLIPEYGDNEKAVRYIERNCKSIFEMQLSGKPKSLTVLRYLWRTSAACSQSASHIDSTFETLPTTFSILAKSSLSENAQLLNSNTQHTGVMKL